MSLHVVETKQGVGDKANGFAVILFLQCILFLFTLCSSAPSVLTLTAVKHLLSGVIKTLTQTDDIKVNIRSGSNDSLILTVAEVNTKVFISTVSHGETSILCKGLFCAQADTNKGLETGAQGLPIICRAPFYFLPISFFL